MLWMSNRRSHRSYDTESMRKGPSRLLKKGMGGVASAVGSDARRRDEGDAGAHRGGAATAQTAPCCRNRLRSREGVSHARWQDRRMEAWLARYGLSFLERCITSSCEEMSARRFSGTTPIGRTTYGGWRATVRSSAFGCWRTA